MRGDRRAEIPEQLDAGLDDVGQAVADRGGVARTVIRGVRLGQAGEALDVLRPFELAAVDDDAAEGGAVAAQELGDRVHDDVGAVLEGADQIGGRDGVVDDQRDAVLVRDIGDRPDVEDVDARVADGLGEEQLGVRAHRALPLGRVVLVLDEGDLDPELRERVLEEVVGAAVDRAGGDEVVAGLRDVQDREGRRRLAARQQEGAGAALERGDALLDHCLGRVHDPGVDVAELGEREQVLRVVRAVEHVGGGLVDRDGSRVGGRVGLGARVHLLGLELPVLLLAHGCSLGLGYPPGRVGDLSGSRMGRITMLKEAYVSTLCAAIRPDTARHIRLAASGSGSEALSRSRRAPRARW